MVPWWVNAIAGIVCLTIGVNFLAQALRDDPRHSRDLFAGTLNTSGTASKTPIYQIGSEGYFGSLSPGQEIPISGTLNTNGPVDMSLPLPHISEQHETHRQFDLQIGGSSLAWKDAAGHYWAAPSREITETEFNEIVAHHMKK